MTELVFLGHSKTGKHRLPNSTITITVTIMSGIYGLRGALRPLHDSVFIEFHSSTVSYHSRA